MHDDKVSFKDGEKVRIKDGPLAGEVGEVIDTLIMRDRPGSPELVWVKMIGGKVEGFSPGNLEKRKQSSKFRAA